MPSPTAQEADAAWARVLATHVNERGEVDFEALAQVRADLGRYVRHVAAVPLASLPDGAPRLAYMINAYSALSMFNVLQSGIPATHAGAAEPRFFAQAAAPDFSVRFTPDDGTVANARRRGAGP